MQILPSNALHLDMLAQIVTGYTIETATDFVGKSQELAQMIIDEMGARDRHCEIVYALQESGELPIIGFYWSQIDRNGKGFLREFYVKPEYRLRGYGREVYRRAEGYFARDGAREAWLAPNSDGARAFWGKCGFADSGEIAPFNGCHIWAKPVAEAPLAPIEFRVSLREYRGPIMQELDLAEQLAMLKGLRGLTDLQSAVISAYRLAEKSEKILILAQNDRDEALGAVVFENFEFKTMPPHWYMHNLNVRWDVRRQGIARAMIKAGINKLAALGAERVYSDTDIANAVSAALHRSVGFIECPAAEASENTSGDTNIYFRMDVL
jgi:GNAT superfamily N-acetyltransferase